MSIEHLDVLIIGAGLSGIGAACHLQRLCPNRSYAILEGRERLGGTWDLFRYPGIRSDSDMYTMGYSFRPWTEPTAIAHGSSILKYLQDTAREYGVDQKIRYSHRVVGAAWSTPHARWTVDIEQGPDKERLQISCNFLFSCSGYYRYDSAYQPQFPGMEQFGGRIVHPQFWTSDIDYAGKHVVVIGSGATAVTLVPSMAKDAAHVTVLQRSPTYVVARPAEDPLATRLHGLLPTRLVSRLTRWKRVLLGMYFFNLCKRQPEKVKRLLLGGVRAYLPKANLERDFTPSYKPWDQRLCLVPDGDYFLALRSGRASIVTDEIERFTETGILLKSGQELPADLIVSATGLELVPLGGMQLSLDGTPVDLSKTLGYKGMMYRDLPNLASVTGYTNASWTLKADLVCEYVCRLLNHMQRHGLRQCAPRLNDPSISEQPWMNLSSGYVQRAMEKFPKQGSKAPWRLYQNYIRDLLALKFGKLNDGVMEFSGAQAALPK